MTPPRIAAVVVLLVLTGCSAGGGQPSGVASLAASNSRGGGAPTTALSPRSAAQLYHDWAQCMRQHGINMADPVVDDQGQTDISLPQGVSIQTYQSANTACQSLHTAAQTAARGGQAPDKPDPTKLLNFSKCMRAHGVADFPDPSPGGGLRISSSPGSDLSPDNPTFAAAQKACQPIIGAIRGGERVTAGSAAKTGG